ncbi:MAG: hypothetical protein KGR26_13270, partial [Cyanobacteria bacterium REEB65]|nr:hypothetical protein [Cyanobacteria bacterium REEB65]
LPCALAILCLGSPSPAHAAPTAPTPYVRRAVVSQGAANRVFDELQLTPAQRQQCMAIVRSGYVDSVAMRGKARDSWHDLMQLLRNPQASLQQAMVQQRELTQLQESLAEKRLVTWFAVRQLLTPAQLARLSSLSLDQPLGFEDENGQQSAPNAAPNARH